MNDAVTTGDGIRDWARYDVSQVPPQGGYIAKQCPVRAQNDVLRPIEPAPVSPQLQRLFDAGNRFEAKIAGLVVHDAVVDRVEDRAERERSTMTAMEDGAHAIYGGRLPIDQAGRRVGEPDLLVRDDRPSSNAPWSYRPIDVKHHLTLATDANGEALCSSLDVPRPAHASPMPGVTGRKHKGDLLQLAHYQRMLEACGWAADEARLGGIVGKEQVVVWWDLDEKLWRTPAVTRKTRMRSTMDVYDFEFAFRLDIMAAAELHRHDATYQLIVVPIRNGECPDCPWRTHCDASLEAGSGDISLIPRLGWAQWKMHRDITGATRRNLLAGLDWRTARLVGDGVDVAALLRQARSHASAESITALVAAERPLAALVGLGITTVGDLDGVCPVTAKYSGYGTGRMDRHIDEARVALDPQQAFRLRDVDGIRVPRADVEIDIDMENVDDGAYLWGALVSDRTGHNVVPDGYRAFAVWDPDPDRYRENFARFWQWLLEQRHIAADHGLSFAAYCYHAGAENGQMRLLACDLADEVETFITDPAWVDLLQVVRDGLVTGDSLSLKQVAPLSGFAWTVADPGGMEAMVHFDAATGDGPDAAAARHWLLEYNRNDVEATLSLRGWLDTIAFPSVADLDAVWHPRCAHEGLS